MDFLLPTLEDTKGSLSPNRSDADCINSTRASLKRKKGIKLSSMPLKENKVLEDVGNSYKVEDHYTLLSSIGTGSYSKVYLAISKKDQSKVAIKMSRGKTAGSLLEREYELLKSLDDPMIPKAIDFQKNTIKNTTYFIMEYFQGQTLDTFIEEQGTIGEDQALVCIKSLAECICRLHKLGIAHRDVKPQNILINSDFEIKLIDFNISKVGKENKTSVKFSKRFMTQISSPLFAAPEIYSPDFYTESVDIWGLGIVLVTMLFGMDIFKNSERLSNKDSYMRFTESLVNSEITTGMKTLIESTLALDADCRLTAQELLETL